MDSKNTECPHCGSRQPQDHLICLVCGKKLDALREKTTRLPQLRDSRYSRHRRLIVGGAVLLALGSCGGAWLLQEKWLLSMPPLAPANLPVDKHRVLNLPLGEYPLSNYTWLPDNTHLLGFDFQTLFLLDVQRGKKDWVQPSVFRPQGLHGRILWSSNRRYVAEVGDVGSVPYDEYRAVVRDILSRQQIWKSPPLGHLGNTFSPFALAPSGTYCALCQDTGDINDSGSDTIVQIWDIQQNHLIKDWSVQEQGQAGDFTVTSMVWSPDNTRLALICAGGSVQVWDSTKGTRLWTHHIANGREVPLQWSPDGTTLALWLFDENNPIRMLDAHTGELLFQATGVDFSAYDANGSNIGSLSDAQPLVWSSDSKLLAFLTYENTVQICDARTGQHLFTCQSVNGHLTGCSWSPDGRYLAAGNIAGGSVSDYTRGENSTIQFWDAQSGKALFAYQAPRAPGQLTWSPDSHFLAVYNAQDYGHVGIHAEFLKFALQVFQVGELG